MSIREPGYRGGRRVYQKKKPLSKVNASLFHHAVINNEASASEPEVNANDLAQLEGMGFPTIRCKKALLANPGNADGAVQWLFEHMDDPDIDAPLTQSSSAAPPVDPGMISMLQDMGFTAPQATKALRETVSALRFRLNWANAMAERQYGTSCRVALQSPRRCRGFGRTHGDRVNCTGFNQLRRLCKFARQVSVEGIHLAQGTKRALRPLCRSYQIRPPLGGRGMGVIQR